MFASTGIKRPLCQRKYLPRPVADCKLTVEALRALVPTGRGLTCQPLCDVASDPPRIDATLHHTFFLHPLYMSNPSDESRCSHAFCAISWVEKAKVCISVMDSNGTFTYDTKQEQAVCKYMQAFYGRDGDDADAAANMRIELWDDFNAQQVECQGEAELAMRGDEGRCSKWMCFVIWAATKTWEHPQHCHLRNDAKLALLRRCLAVVSSKGGFARTVSELWYIQDYRAMVGVVTTTGASPRAARLPKQSMLQLIPLPPHVSWESIRAEAAAYLESLRTCLRRAMESDPEFWRTHLSPTLKHWIRLETLSPEVERMHRQSDRIRSGMSTTVTLCGAPRGGDGAFVKLVLHLRGGTLKLAMCVSVIYDEHGSADEVTLPHIDADSGTTRFTEVEVNYHHIRAELRRHRHHLEILGVPVEIFRHDVARSSGEPALPVEILCADAGDLPLLDANHSVIDANWHTMCAMRGRIDIYQAGTHLHRLPDELRLPLPKSHHLNVPPGALRRPCRSALVVGDRFYSKEIDFENLGVQPPRRPKYRSKDSKDPSRRYSRTFRVSMNAILQRIPPPLCAELLYKAARLKVQFTCVMDGKDDGILTIQAPSCGATDSHVHITGQASGKLLIPDNDNKRATVGSLSKILARMRIHTVNDRCSTFVNAIRDDDRALADLQIFWHTARQQDAANAFAEALHRSVRSKALYANFRRDSVHLGSIPDEDNICPRTQQIPDDVDLRNAIVIAASAKGLKGSKGDAKAAKQPAAKKQKTAEEAKAANATAATNNGATEAKGATGPLQIFLGTSDVRSICKCITKLL